MSTHINFLLKDELKEQLSGYCLDKKLTMTEAMNLAVQKLISGQGGGQTSGTADNAVVDEIYKIVCKHFLLYKNFSIKNPDAEINNAEIQINTNTAAELKKLKKGGK